MPKNKERSGEEYWRGKFREVTRENKALKKRLKQLERKEFIFDDTAKDLEEFLVEEEKAIINSPVTCPKCLKGEFRMILNFDTKQIFSCTECMHKKTVKT